MKKLLFFLILLFSTKISLAQATIRLKNPSFEDTPKSGQVPSGWKNCGQAFESPPDTQPDPTFGVTTPAYHGKTYMGLVVRDNDTWEQAGQALSDELVQGQCYRFSLWLARSGTYRSRSRMTGRRASYTTPVVLRIWGGNAQCEKKELLAVTDPVFTLEWQEYSFVIAPIKGNYSHIIIEAYYKERYGDAYNGNILVDHASELIPIDCNTPSGD